MEAISPCSFYRSESIAKYRVVVDMSGLIVSRASVAARKPIIAEMIRSMNELWLYLQASTTFTYITPSFHIATDELE